MVWDLFKINVKEYTILYCKKRKHKKQNVKFEYENKLKEIDLKLANLKFNENIELRMEREQVKTKLDAISMEKARGYYIRSRAQWFEEGEKSTRYFLSLENKTQQDNCIHSSKTANGKTLNHNNDILEVTVNCYSNLYSSKNPVKINNEFYQRRTLFTYVE